MADKWVVDAAHPQGHLVPMTAAEQAQLDADQAAAATATTQAETRQANAATIRQNLRDRMQQAADIADALEAGTATAAQQRQGLALALRGVVRLARLVNADLDTAA